MEKITHEQYNSLLKGKIPTNLDEHIKSDVLDVKAILLSQEGDNYYLEYIELENLSEEEKDEISSYGCMVKFG